MTAVLELREVSKVYGTGPAEVDALRRVSLSVGGGELVAVMGPSGSGKSTLLTIAGSLEEPTGGQVLVAGNDLSGFSPNDQAKLRRRLIGYVFQDSNLLAGLAAVENGTLPLELDGVGIKAARPAGMKALEELGVANRAGRFPDELSGGERQRVAIARAVVGDRQVLLADEPTGALDSVNGEAVMRLLLAACRRGVAGVVVTHDAQFASCADRVVFLRDGRIIDQTRHAPTADRFPPLPQGRSPAGAGQAAITGQIAQPLQLHIGSLLSIGGHHQTVTGFVENPSDLSDQFVLVPPSVAGPPQSVTVLLNASPASFGAFRTGFRGPLEWQARGASTQAAVVGGVLGAVTVLLLLVSLVADAGFAR